MTTIRLITLLVLTVVGSSCNKTTTCRVKGHGGNDIQAAIDRVHAKGGGVVIVPEGHYDVGSIQLKSNVELHLEKGAQKIINNDGIDFDGCSHVRVKDSRCQTIRLGCPSDDTIRNAFFTGIEASGNNGIFADFPTRYLDSGDEGYMDIHDIVFDVSCEYPIRFIGNPGYEIGTITLEDFKATVGVEGDPVIVSGCKHLNLERVSVNGEKPLSLQQSGDRRSYQD